MTTFGHSLTGLALLTWAIPPNQPWGRRLAWIILFIALANIPDWPLTFWGHRQLQVSHSLWVNAALCAATAMALRKAFVADIGRKRLLAAGAAAWLSHFVLDTLYGDLPGVAIYWPFGDGLATMGLPWLNTLPHIPPPFDASVLKILVYELLTFAPLILGAWGLRRARRRKERSGI